MALDTPSPISRAAALDHVRSVTKASGTSFALGMKILPEARRDGMHGLYAFCREVDDIADEPGTEIGKLAALDDWRGEIERLYAGAPTFKTTVALLPAIEAFDLPKAEFHMIVDGMETDARERMHGPDRAALRLYCRQVAGAVGMISVRIFGATEPAREPFAEALGDAFQLTNILRDIHEDAERDRLYLPSNLLDRHGIASRNAAEVMAHPALKWVLRDLGREARASFREADRLLAECRRSTLRPALVMRGVYELYLDRMQARGWHHHAEPLKVAAPVKAWAAIRKGYLF